MPRGSDRRIQRTVVKWALLVNGRRGHSRDAHGIAVAAGDGGIFVVHRPARVGTVRQAVSPRRIIDFNDRAGVSHAHGPTHLKPTLRIVNKGNEALPSIA